MSSALKSLRALSDPTRLRMVALAGAGRTVGERAAGGHAARPVAHLHASGPVAGRRAAAIAARRQADILHVRTAAPTAQRGNSSNWRSAARRNCPNTKATRSISSASSPAAASRRRFISTRSPGASTGFMGRAVRGRRSGICCCGFCRRWSWPTSARARAC